MNRRRNDPTQSFITANHKKRCCLIDSDGRKKMVCSTRWFWPLACSINATATQPSKESQTMNIYGLIKSEPERERESFENDSDVRSRSRVQDSGQERHFFFASVLPFVKLQCLIWTSSDNWIPSIPYGSVS